MNLDAIPDCFLRPSAFFFVLRRTAVCFLLCAFFIFFALQHAHSKDAFPLGHSAKQCVSARANLKPLQRGAIVDFHVSSPGVCSILQAFPPKKCALARKKTIRRRVDILFGGRFGPPPFRAPK
ncbi:MAG: hypothetical protein IKC51_01430 [Myxococcaceae bacterium]|nr:hypothetical protein [Myxococcaceae bacterium]